MKQGKKLIENYKNNIGDVRNFMKAMEEDTDPNDLPDDLLKYTLDYFPSGTFPNQEKSYFSYAKGNDQLREEFRFFCDEAQKPYRIEFWLSEWSKNENKILKDKNYKLMLDFFDFLKESGDVKAAIEKAPWKD